jgi:hypothetical protein
MRRKNGLVIPRKWTKYSFQLELISRYSVMKIATHKMRPARNLFAILERRLLNKRMSAIK